MGLAPGDGGGGVTAGTGGIEAGTGGAGGEVIEGRTAGLGVVRVSRGEEESVAVVGIGVADPGETGVESDSEVGTELVITAV